MSLKAAEKARRASEEFVQRVNDLIPDNPKKYHKDLLMGIDDKLALLKKNVVSNGIFQTMFCPKAPVLAETCPEGSYLHGTFMFYY